MPKHLMHRVINIAIKFCEFVTKELWEKNCSEFKQQFRAWLGFVVILLLTF